MDPELVRELYHWIPTPLLALGFVIMLRRSLNEFEGKLASVLIDLKEVIKAHNNHERRVDRIEERVEQLWGDRKRVHELKIELERLKSYMAGSGPKRNPLYRGGVVDDDEGDE